MKLIDNKLIAGINPKDNGQVKKEHFNDIHYKMIQDLKNHPLTKVPKTRNNGGLTKGVRFWKAVKLILKRLSMGPLAILAMIGVVMFYISLFIGETFKSISELR